MYDEYRITLSLVPDGIFDIEKKAWQMTASKAVAQVLKECYGGVAPNVLGVTAMHALGVTASTQAVSQHLIQFEPPLGAVSCRPRSPVFPYPSGEVSHPSHGPQKALLMPVKARYLLDGNAMGGYFYPRGSKDKPHYDSKAHKKWLMEMGRTRAKVRKRNGYLHVPLRVSPRLSESQKRSARRLPARAGRAGPGRRPWRR